MSDEKALDIRALGERPDEDVGEETIPTLRRKLIEQRLVSEQLDLIGSAVRVAGWGVVILTPAVEATGPRIAFVNEGFCSIYRCSPLDVVGQTPLAFGIVERQEAILADLMQHVFERQTFEAEATARRKDGAEFELDLQIIPVADRGEVTHWVAFLRDVTDLKNQVGLLRHQATHDALTGLPNRSTLLDQLESAITASRGRGSKLALLLMDLDRFKEVNDTFGHPFGDELLKQIAARLQNQAGEGDAVARVGGDEFVVIVHGPRDEDAVAATAKKILDTLQHPFVVHRHVLEVSASIGIAVHPAHGDDARTLLRRADVAMYAAKNAQSGFAFHRDEYESRSPDELGLVVEMRQAMERDDFELYYQPKLHLRSGLMTRAEVLIRWNHPKRGLLPPAAFIPVAERTGLIRNMTDWIFDHALAQCRAWHATGAPVHLAINVSAKSMLEQSLPEKVQSLLEKWKVEARFVKMEITEHSIMADPKHALDIMSRLQALGIRISIDDFGTGYSSLIHLRQLPVDEIKIDKSFVMGMRKNEADAAVVRAVIDLGHNLGKQVCAEGVEDHETWWQLTDLGCDLAQGYFIAKPMPSDSFMNWLIDSAWGVGRVPVAR